VRVCERPGCEKDKDSVGIAYGRDSDRTVWRRLRHSAGRPAQAQLGKAFQRCFNVDEERHHEQPSAGRPDGSAGRDVAADERIELEHSREDVGDFSVAEEHDARAPARTVEECRPITLDLTIRQYVEADPVAVEPYALVEVPNDDNRVMDRAGDPSTLPAPVRRRGSAGRARAPRLDVELRLARWSIYGAERTQMDATDGNPGSAANRLIPCKQPP
jgi:hypothetical protein